jgi:hypothetical protein
LPPLPSLMSRILRGLLGLKGPVYKLIRHLLARVEVGQVLLHKWRVHAHPPHTHTHTESAPPFPPLLLLRRPLFLREL